MYKGTAAYSRLCRCEGIILAVLYYEFVKYLLQARREWDCMLQMLYRKVSCHSSTQRVPGRPQSLTPRLGYVNFVDGEAGRQPQRLFSWET